MSSTLQQTKKENRDMKLNLPNHLYRNGSLAGSEAGKLLQSWQRRFYYSPRRIGGKWVNKRLIVLLTIQRLAISCINC